MKKLYPCIRLTLLCLLSIPFFPNVYSQQVAKSISASTGDQVGFLEYKPPTYDKDVSTKYPLIIFLHGIGERGNGTTDLQNITLWGIPKSIKEGYTMKFTWNGKTETFLVISPQCPVKYSMWPSAIIDDLIKYAKQNLRIDPNRILLTGLSMGGGGTLRYISDALPDDPKNIAAAAPISSPCTFRTGQYAAEAHLPVWCFHAQDDPTASVTCTMNAMAGLNQWNPVVKPMLTLWPTGGHAVWDRLYDDTSYKYQDVVSIYEWFLAQNKSLPANKLPVARAGSDITVPPGIIQLNGSASSDPDGKIVRYVWKKLSGPASGTITTPRGTASSTTVTGVTLSGTYSYELAVADDRASFTRDTVKITVNSSSTAQLGPVPGDNPPVANAGTDITIYTSWNQTLLNSTLSKDNDGWITSVKWSEVSGPSTYAITDPNALKTYATNLVAGVYVFRATVTDNGGASAYDDVTVTVLPGSSSSTAPPPNTELVANAGTDVTIYTSWNQTLINSTLSKSTKGWITSVKWSEVSGPSTYAITDPTALKTYATNLVAGVYVFRVTVTDNTGASANDDVTVTVLPGSTSSTAPPPNAELVANAGTDITIYTSWNQTLINSTLSKSTKGWITSVKWSKVSGPANYAITDPTALKTYATNLVAGVYVFRVTVTDNTGASANDDVTVTVLAGSTSSTAPPPNAELVANAGTDITIYTSWNQTLINSTLSKSTKGWITSVKWSKVSGPANYAITDPTALKTYATNLVAGVYVFRVTVTDNTGASAYDDLTVTVLAGSGPPASPLIANAGTDITIYTSWNQTLINSTLSKSNEGWITSVKWSKVSGPANYAIADPTALKTYATNLVAGVYVFRVTVTDNKGASAYDDMTVTVLAGSPPPGQSLTLDESEPAITNKSAATGELTVYPNPAISTIQLQYSYEGNGKTFINIYDVNGRLAKTIAGEKNQQVFLQSINISDLTRGIYFIIAETDQYRSRATRFVKQ